MKPMVRVFHSPTMNTVLMAFCVLAVVEPALAQASACGPKLIGTGEVTAVLDGRSFRLDDGRDVRLAGIDVPLIAPAERQSSEAAIAARTALTTLIQGRTVQLKAASSTADRYGRLVAFASVSDEIPVQYLLLAQGHARVAQSGDEAACRADLLKHESTARIARLGLWGDPAYAVRPAGEAPSLAANRGRYTVVEGKVLSVRTSGSTTYMNFARRWSTGFAVTIRKRDERTFAAAGLAPKSLEGKRIRVRGYIEQRSGPRIEGAEPAQIEMAERQD
jgi:endonuclease YncB( thermonuclease family)